MNDLMVATIILGPLALLVFLVWRWQERGYCWMGIHYFADVGGPPIDKQVGKAGWHSEVFYESRCIHCGKSKLYPGGDADGLG